MSKRGSPRLTRRGTLDCIVKANFKKRWRHLIDAPARAAGAWSLLLVLALAGCGGGGSSPPPPPSNPVPTVTALSPASATAGGAAFTLTVTGTKFISSSVVRWNAASRTTTFVSGTQLTAAISASEIALAGTAQVTVFNPSPGGGTSNAFAFTINNPAPTADSLSPSSAVAGGPGFTLAVTGSNFVPQSVVRWNGAERTTTFASSTQASVAILAADIASAGTAQVTVFNPAPGGGASAALAFTIQPSMVLQITTSFLPASAGGKSYDFTLASSGGVPPVRWDLTAGALPAGLTLDSASGRISGAIDSSANGSTFPLTVQVTDNAVTSQTASRTLSLQVKSPPLGSNDTLATATPISNGTLRASISPHGDVDFYAFQANAGATVRVEIFARRLSPESFLDSILEILDSSGTRPSTCRSPDQPRDPNNPLKVLDPTPEAFDDICLSDDITLGVMQDSLLEFQPSAGGTYYINVRDFRGDGRPDLIYDLTLSGAN